MLIAYKTAEQHFQFLNNLLELEAEAERIANLNALKNKREHNGDSSGQVLTNLVIRSQDAGMGGRFLLNFAKRNQNLSLPWTRLEPGCPVILYEEGNQRSDTVTVSWRGVVSQLKKDTIQVAFTQLPLSENKHAVFRLERSTDEISRQRQRSAMRQVQEAPRDSRIAILRDILLGTQMPMFRPPEPITLIDSKLNSSQKKAVEFALSTDDVAIIHGPPGTGKTTTMVELIRQIVQNDESVLVVAPSNLAVDNLLEKLLSFGQNALRLGHPARILPGLHHHTLDELVENHPDMRLVQKLTRQAYDLFDQAEKYTRAKPEPGQRKSIRDEAKSLLAEAKKVEKQITLRVLDSAHIICATNTGLDPEMLGDRIFNWCIMDEAGQSTEPSTWIPLLYAQNIVFTGDHYQLPPTVISHEAAVRGLNVSLMERVLSKNPENISKMLTIQYRMHADIMNFSSAYFYGNSLIADNSVIDHRLCDLPGVVQTELTETPIHFIDTAGASYDEQLEENGTSTLNPLEAQLVLKKLDDLIDSGVQPNNIGIITPYAAQANILRNACKHSQVDIDSVDGFQGREKETIIVSLVRSNPEGNIGFLADTRRMNVALTRARRKLIVIGDSATITVNPFYNQMINYFESINAYHSVWEEN
ncbi:MAG: DNA-binding protein [Chloroflexi bacterium HGW-Chloroflexi-10]|nr:MAG: DNA-binding protein [Chloroflexi bacterium HGW-Chloroflexi-10]